MKISWIGLVDLITCASADAIQAVEAGLQPLHDRSRIVIEAQQVLNQRLRAPDTPLEQRAAAYRAWKALEQERQALVAGINESRKLANSPLVTFAYPSELKH